jgi:hypothetical protein
VASLQWRSAAKGEIGMTKTCVTCSTIEMHATGLKTGAKSASASSRNDMKRGTMTTMAPTMTNGTDSALPRGDAT